MNGSMKWMALVVVSTAAACGQQLVQFGESDMPMSDGEVDLPPADMRMPRDFAPGEDLTNLADGPLPDLEMRDLLVPDLAMPDLVTRDFLMPDLETRDLVMHDLLARDLAMPDLARPDLSMPDLAIVDLSIPDLAVPDLAVPDLAVADGAIDLSMPDQSMADLVTGNDLLALNNPRPLKSLESYALLASSTITNSGPSTIIGSIGLSPGAMIVGIPMGMPINGSIHIADGPAAQAQMDLTFVYDLVSARPCEVDLTGQDLGGKTLAPAVYCFDVGAGMAIGSTLILDSKGDPNASWTFKVGSTLILGDFATMHVINGGRDCSVFWRVGSSATLGLGTHAVGNILAQASITMPKGASAGRALARTGAVTMDTDDIAIGPCQ